MIPIDFPEANRTLAPPPMNGPADCGSLRVFTNGQQCISCWRLSLWERIQALLTGRLWAFVWYGGSTQPPIGFVIGRTVFEEAKDAHN